MEINNNQQPATRNSQQICSHCILPANFPGVTFDDNGVCNQCRSLIGNEALDEQKMEYEKKFSALLSPRSLTLRISFKLMGLAETD